MNRYCIKIKFTNNTDIKIKHKINRKILVYSYFIDCGFKKFEIYLKQCYHIV